MSHVLTPLNEYGKKRQPCVFIIDFQATRLHIFPAEEAQANGLQVVMPTFSNALPALSRVGRQGWEGQITPPSEAEYALAYSLAYQHLLFGNSYLLNLSAPTRIATGWGLEAIFQATQAKYKVFWQDAVSPFVCFSPETFVQIRAGKVYAYPMKGTIDASIPEAEKIILADKKELAEHYTIVDLLRNDLSQVAKRVRVARFRYIDRLQTWAGKELLQVSSEVVGKLPKNYHAHLGDIFMALLPAGSISGAPKRKTLEVIEASESTFRYAHGERYTRGFYTGICGYFDGENVDTGVMIRYIQQVGKDFYFKSGGGITTQSTLQAEYNELIQKVYVPIA